MKNIAASLLVSSLLALPACLEAPLEGQSEEELAASENNVVLGSVEPDWKHPWVVLVAGGSCRGVLLHPSWVLTAAHCVSGVWSGKISYSRTDPATGKLEGETRTAIVGQNQGTFVHPDWGTGSSFLGDIALVRLSQPFTITPLLQTVGLPKTPRQAGMVGTVASFSHTGELPPGSNAILRAPILEWSSLTSFIIRAPDASLCPGDSGSGFVTVENGRATVRGVASNSSVGDCTQPNREAGLTDVFAYKSWILQTMAMNDHQVAGNTRVKWAGKAGKGVMGIGCTNPAGTMWGPMNVLGAQEGVNCPAGETQAVVCNLQGTQSTMLAIKAFKLRTTHPNGTVTTQSLPVSSGTWASYYGNMPAGTIREFTCEVGNPIVSLPGGGVFSP